MKRGHLLFGAIVFALLLASSARPVLAQSEPVLGIVHTPPTGAVPGLQVYLAATLTNATSATVAWRNDTMSADAVVPMTNLTRPNGTGWVYAAYLPAQSSPTQITYAINASNAGAFRIESYFLSVAVPTASGITSGDQTIWMWTMAASISMAASTIAVLYWYIGRRLRRGGS